MRCGIYVRVSTDDQRDNGYSIDSQLRMIKEYCEKNDYDIVDVYNDAGHSGKDLMRPEMQRLLKDIKSKKIDKLIAIKVDRLTRNNYDGFWLLNYCEEHDVKIELILEPYDVSTANGEMIFGMNLVFGQRERKEIGARTKRAMEEMALERIHPSKAPYGYIRNKETGHLEVEPIEAEVVKEIFELCKQGNSTRSIATIMKDNNAYLKQGKWKSDRVYKILSNSIYIGVFEYGKYKRKPQDILRVENYCEPIIDEVTWNATRNVLVKNKHSNYGEYIHLFSGLVKCPICGEIMSSSESFKYPNAKQKVYYHLRCKNHNCSGFGLHYNTEKIETKLKQVLEELTLFMLSMDNEIITCNSTKSDDVKDIEKAIRLYSAALDLADEHNNSNLIEVSLTNLASLYVISKRHISNDLLQRIELSARQDTVYGYHTLTDVSLLKNHIDSARYYLELAKAHTTDICDMAELQYTAYHIEVQAKNFEKATDNVHRYIYLNDSIMRSNMQFSAGMVERDYFKERTKFAQYRMKNRTVWEIAIAAATFFIIGIAWYIVRQRLRMQRDRTNHYLLLTEKANSEYKALTERVKKQQTTESYLRGLAASRFDIVDKLGKTYYERENTTSQQSVIFNEVKQIITDFAESNEILQELEKIVNTCHDNAMYKLKEDFPTMKTSDTRLLCYIFVGFSPQVISLFMKDTVANVYARKSRLKSRIKSAKIVNKELFLNLLG